MVASTPTGRGLGIRRGVTLCLILALGAGCAAEELTETKLQDNVALSSRSITGNAVTPDTLRLAPGASGTASCQPLNADRNPLKRNCNWSSRDESVATVSGSGTRTGHITARKAGATWIVASAEKKKDSVRVIVGVTGNTPPDTTPTPPPSDTTPTPTPPPSDTTPTPPPPQPGVMARGCPTSGYLRLVSVSTNAQIANALSNAQPGDQIRIAAGTYSGAFSLSRSGTATSPLVVCGVPGASPVLKGGQFRSTASYLVMTGLIFEGASSVEYTNNVYLHDAHHVTFSGNEIRGGHYHAGLSVDESHHFTITYNYIHDNGHDTSHDHGIYFKTTTGPGTVIANNLLVRNAARGISLHDNSGPGVYDVLVAHNTIVANGSTGILVNDGDRNTVVNNIAAYNGDKTGQAQIRVLAGNQNQARNNVTYSSSSSRGGIENTTSSSVSGNVVSEPRLMANFANLDLQAGSPAVNFGLPGYAQDKDYAGQTRDGSPDAGAYEK